MAENQLQSSKHNNKMNDISRHVKADEGIASSTETFLKIDPPPRKVEVGGMPNARIRTGKSHAETRCGEIYGKQGKGAASNHNDSNGAEYQKKYTGEGCNSNNFQRNILFQSNLAHSKTVHQPSKYYPMKQGNCDKVYT